MIVALVSLSSSPAAPPPCRDAIQKTARALPALPLTTEQRDALPAGAPDQRMGCGQTCRPSGGYKVIPLTPAAVIATSELDGSIHRADRAIDGNPDTAWAEGARGPGRGEGLVFVFDEPVSIDLIEIIPGHARSETTFIGNHRLREAWLTFHPWPRSTILPAPAPPRYARQDGVEPTCDVATQPLDAVVLSGDPREPVPLRWDLSPHFCRNPGAGMTRHVVLRIGDIVEGRRFDDTAISEVRFARLEPILGSKGWVCR
ncbi:MAG: hypothetical protein AAF602_02360 [Myxococcota bacterium]